MISFFHSKYSSSIIKMFILFYSSRIFSTEKLMNFSVFAIFHFLTLHRMHKSPVWKIASEKVHRVNRVESPMNSEIRHRCLSTRCRSGVRMRIMADFRAWINNKQCQIKRKSEISSGVTLLQLGWKHDFTWCCYRRLDGKYQVLHIFASFGVWHLNLQPACNWKILF